MVSKSTYLGAALIACAAFPAVCHAAANPWLSLIKGGSDRAMAYIASAMSDKSQWAEQGAQLRSALDERPASGGPQLELGFRVFSQLIGVSLGADRTTIGNNHFIRNKDLYAMENMDFPKVEHTAILDHGYFIFSGDPVHTDLTIYGTNRGRLKYGISGIANDGSTVELCRFWASPGAPYYEVSRLDRARLEEFLGFAKGDHAPCLEGDAADEFWSLRYQSLLNQRGEEVN